MCYCLVVFAKPVRGRMLFFCAPHWGGVFCCFSLGKWFYCYTLGNIRVRAREGEESQHKGFSGVTQLVTAIVLFHLFSALTAREGVGSSWRGRRLRDAANKGVDLLVPLYALFCTILAVLLKQKEKNTCLPYLIFSLFLQWCCSE